MKVPSLLVILGLCGQFVTGSKILVVFNTPSKSHTILGVKLSDVLLKRGHHVTLITPFDVEKKDNLTHIHLRNILEYREEMMKEDFGPQKNRFAMFFMALDFFKKISQLTFEHPDIQRIIKEKPKYDLMILMPFFNDATIAIGHHLSIPVVAFHCIGTNFLNNKYMANPNVVYVPNPMITISTETFVGRLAAVTLNALLDFFTGFLLDQNQQEVINKHISNPPTLEQLRKSMPLMLVNSHYSVEPLRPYLPNMIQIGGFHVQEAKKLPDKIKNYLDGAASGAILFSLGSNVEVAKIEQTKRDSIFKVLGELSPMRVIFKSELEHKDVPENVMVMKWVPQADILAHPKLKVFISHGGYGGNTEAVYHGVPILGFPFFGDQLMNMMEAEKAGYARLITYDTFTEESFRERLRDVIENPAYAKNAKVRSALMRDQPVKPADNIIFWIEHIIKYGGGKHFQNPGMYLTWYQLYMVDIYIFYTILFALIIVLNFYIVKWIIRMIRRVFTSQKVKTN